MNISEINASSPRYWHVLMFGIPLAILTALLPIYFNRLWRFSYRILPMLRQAFQTPFTEKILVCINFSLLITIIVLIGTSRHFVWGPVVGFGAWALFACFVLWIRQSHLFWAHWLSAMLCLLVLVLLAVEDASVWSLLVVLIYWVLRDWLSLKEFFVWLFLS